MMKTAKKLMAFLLAICLCAGMIVPTVLAEEKETIDVVTVGNSVTTGFGLADYHAGGFLDGASEKSLPCLFCDYLSEKLGETAQVNNINLSAEGMRFDELRGILDPTFDPSYKAGGRGDVYFASHKQSISGYYNAQKGAFGGKDIHAAYRDAMTDAEIIILDLEVAGIGLAMSQSINDLVAGLPTETLDDIAQEIDFNIIPVRDAVKAMINRFMPEIPGFTPDKVSALLELLVYAQCNMLVNCERDIALIRELNKDARIIVVGAYGLKSDLIASLGAVEIDAAALWKTYCGIADTLLTSVCKYKDEYSFAAMPNGLETFVCGAAMGESYPAFEDAVVRSIQKELRGTQHSDCSREQLKEGFAKVAQTKVIDLSTLLVSDKPADLSAFADFDHADEAQKAYAKFFICLSGANAYGFHPDQNGCMQKFVAVRDAYESGRSADGSKGEAIYELSEGVGKTVFSVIKAPLLEIMSSVFEKISNAIHEFFAPIFSLPFC